MGDLTRQCTFARGTWQTPDHLGPRFAGTRKEGGQRARRQRLLAPCGATGPRAAAAVAPARRKESAQQRLRTPQGVAPYARQQWADDDTVTGHSVLGACANAQGAGAIAGVLQAV